METECFFLPGRVFERWQVSVFLNEFQATSQHSWSAHAAPRPPMTLASPILRDSSRRDSPTVSVSKELQAVEALPVPQQYATSWPGGEFVQFWGHERSCTFEFQVDAKRGAPGTCRRGRCTL